MLSSSNTLTDSSHRLQYKVKKDPYDSRDLSRRFDNKEVDDVVDLRIFCSPVEDQMHLGSCVAQAIVGAFELLINKDSPDKFLDLSRLFLYYNARLLENFVEVDSGAYTRDGVKAATRWGICSEALWPYLIDKFDDLPDKESYFDAEKRIIRKYYRADTIEDIITALHNGYPVVASMNVFEGFDDLPEHGKLPIPSLTDYMLGSHAICIVGYDNIEKYFICRNSFGEQWGDQGYFYMPYVYAEKHLMDNWFFDIRVK